MLFIKDLNFEQATNLELEYLHDGMEMVPGYIVDCTDGHSYLLFAPDMSSLKHMHSYYHIMDMVKFDPLRECIYPAMSYEKNEYGYYKAFCAPTSEMGKIFLVK